MLDEPLGNVSIEVTTSAHHYSTTNLHILNDREIRKGLEQVLFDAMPDYVILSPLATLEELKYLTAILAESHRLTHGVVH